MRARRVAVWAGLTLCATGCRASPPPTSDASAHATVVMPLPTPPALASSSAVAPVSACRPAGRLAAARAGHAATLLRDGRVLLVGGHVLAPNVPNLATSELFDPKVAGTTAAAPMPRGRSRPSALLLRDGRVLVVGGDGEGRENDEIAFVYDPVSDRWATVKGTWNGCGQPLLAELPDGRVLVTAGHQCEDLQTSLRAALFDPRTRRWSTLKAVGVSAMFLQHADRLVAVGPPAHARDRSETEFGVYDAARDIWETVAKDDPGFVVEEGLVIDLGIVLVGERASGNAVERKGRVYDTSWHRVRDVASPPTLEIFAAHGSLYGLHDRRVVRWIPTSDTWETRAELRTKASEYTATVIEGGAKLLVAGGLRKEASDELEICDL